MILVTLMLSASDMLAEARDEFWLPFVASVERHHHPVSSTCVGTTLWWRHPCFKIVRMVYLLLIVLLCRLAQCRWHSMLC